MADGNNDFEIFQGPKPSEKREMSDEQFRDQMAQAQAAMQQLQKEEGKAKAYDHALATIIVHFLSDPKNTDLFILVSRVVALNVPSELIIAILALVDDRAHKEVTGLLKAGAPSGQIEVRHAELVVRPTDDFKALPIEVKNAIQQWTEDLNRVAHKNPARVLDTILTRGYEKKLSAMLIQLSAFILRNFLAKNNLTYEFEILRSFMEEVFVGIVKSLELWVKENKAKELAQ